MADDFIISYGDLIGDDGTFEQLTADLKKLKAELLALAKISKKAFSNTNPGDTQKIAELEKAVKEYEQGMKNVIKTEKALQQTKKKTIDLTQEELIQREAIKIENRERVQRAKQLAIIAKAESDSIAKVRAQLSLTTLAWKKLSASELDNTENGRKLVKTKLALTNQLKALEKQTGDNRRNVGNYNGELKRTDKIAKTVRKTLIRLFVGRTVIDGVLRLGGAFKGLVDDFRDSNETIGGIGKSFDKVTGALQFAGVKILEFLAPAIEVVANLLAKLPAVFAGIASGASQFGTNVSATFKKLGLQIELVFAKINRNNPFSDQNAEEIEANIRRVERAIQSQTDRQAGVAEAYKTAYNAVIKEQEEFVNRQEEIDKKATAKKAREDAKKLKAEQDRKDKANQKGLEALAQAELKESEAREKAIEEQAEKRIQALESVIKEIEQLEADGISDKTDRLIALEELRYKLENEQREAQFAELEALTKKQGEDLQEVQDLNDKKAEQQEESHQEKLAKIRADGYAQERNEKLKQQQEFEEFEEEYLNGEAEADDRRVAKAIENDKKIAKSKEELFTNISASANKVGELITDLFTKQADLSKESVDEQVQNLDRARERTSKGLEADLVFEEKELAKRQSEQQQKEKEAKQSAKILALFNLVSAYAASGDTNALARGLVDFSLLTAFDSLFDGTEDTGTVANPLDSKGGRFAMLHDNERVVPKALNMQLDGMSNADLVNNAIIGSSMGDYFPMQSPVTQNLYKSQREAFNEGMKVTTQGSTEMVKELKAIKQHLASQPNYSADMVQLQEDVYGFIIKEQKKGMRKIYQKVLRAKK